MPVMDVVLDCLGAQVQSGQCLEVFEKERWNWCRWLLSSPSFPCSWLLFYVLCSPKEKGAISYRPDIAEPFWFFRFHQGCVSLVLQDYFHQVNFLPALQDYFGFIRYLSCLIYILSLLLAHVFQHLIFAVLLQISICLSAVMTIIYMFMLNCYKILLIVLDYKVLTHLPWLWYLVCLCLGSRQTHINYILLSLLPFYGCHWNLLWSQTQWLTIWSMKVGVNCNNHCLVCSTSGCKAETCITCLR